jgi:hypothetical protein
MAYSLIRQSGNGSYHHEGKRGHLSLAISVAVARAGQTHHKTFVVDDDDRLVRVSQPAEWCVAAPSSAQDRP